MIPKNSNATALALIVATLVVMLATLYFRTPPTRIKVVEINCLEVRVDVDWLSMRRRRHKYRGHRRHTRLEVVCAGRGCCARLCFAFLQTSFVCVDFEETPAEDAEKHNARAKEELLANSIVAIEVVEVALFVERGRRWQWSRIRRIRGDTGCLKGVGVGRGLTRERESFDFFSLRK